MLEIWGDANGEGGWGGGGGVGGGSGYRDFPKWVGYPRNGRITQNGGWGGGVFVPLRTMD